MRKLLIPSLFLGAVMMATAAASCYLAFFHAQVGNGHPPDFGRPLKNIPFKGAEAYEYLNKLCGIGPRPSGSPGMVAQQKLLADHFAAPRRPCQFSGIPRSPSAGRQRGADGQFDRRVAS